MLLTIKRAIAKNIGKNIELCREAFEEGRKQGRILVEAQKAKQQQDTNKVAEPKEEAIKSNQEAYNEYSQTHTAYRDDTVPA
tara:strand:+ start:1092 stop:1337 length:246 start_codon:yes stop_codon:yes gene_type:complete